MQAEMRRLFFGLVALAAACADPQYMQPPAGSYTAATRQVRIDGAVASLQGAAVTPDFFNGAGVRPFLGRFFVDADYASAARAVVVLSNDLWKERHAGLPAVIGRAGFAFPEGRRLWTPKRGGGP